MRNEMKASGALLLLAVAVQAQTASVLNMSKDLVANHIAATNLTPDTPALDARPLFEAAAAYASANKIATLTATPGKYYFLTTHTPNQHALLSGISNLTVDWQNSDLYFAVGNTAAIDCAACDTVTLENFTVDYQQLPFTQATVTAVDAANRKLTFQTLPGWQSPADFNTNRSPDGSDAIYMFLFRNGVPLTQVGRLTAARPVTGTQISISNATDPWAQSSALAAIQPGDTIVWTDRSGPPAITAEGGQKVTVSNVSIYSAGQVALYFGRVAGAAADRVQVIPRPGTARLISANADGIHVSFGLANNNFTNNIVRRTCDDAPSISSGWIATVSQVVNSTTLTVTRNNDSPFPVGASISLINTTDATVSGTANIVSENPPVSAQKLTGGESVTLTLDKAIAGATGGFGVVDADSSKRASGSVIAYNTVQEVVYSRGIWLSGVQGANVHDNFIQRTANDGILIQELTAGANAAGPSSGITAKNNVVDSALSYGGISAGPVVTASSIHTVAESSAGAQVTSSPFSSIAFTGNRVTNSPRTAIRLENVSGGTVTGNTIQGFGLAPSANVYLIPPCCESMAQYIADFAMAILTNSGLYTAAPNTVGDTGNLISTVSSASYFPKVAPGSFAVAYGPNLAPATMVATAPLPASLGGVTVQITDSAGAVQTAPIYYVVAPTSGVANSSAVCFLVPDGLAAGIATVAISSSVGTSTGGVEMAAGAPGIYTANASGAGVAAALAALYGADGSVTPQPVFSCAAGAGNCVTVPMSLGGASDNLIVSLYGTGWRNAPAAGAWARIGDTAATIQYIGPVPGVPGLDQANLIVPKRLAGAGNVPVVLSAGGQTANAVTISIQ
jgi:uncharacterized protein (TIGR03437 family)